MHIEHHSQWQLQEAKAHLSQLVRKAEKSPQMITVHGEPKVVVVSFAEYNAQPLKRRPKESAISLLHIMQNSPLAEFGIEIERDRSLPREENLFE